MKRVNLLLDEEDLPDINIGILNIKNTYSDHKLFYCLNKLNNCHFKRMEDFIFEGENTTYYHSVFKGYHEETKTSITFISNQSYHYEQKKEAVNLFTTEIKVNFLLKEHTFNAFLIKTRPFNTDFSLILLPEELPIVKEILLNKSQDIYHLIESYE